MKLIKGNLWDGPEEIKCITTCGNIDKGGQLVMGAGIALQAKEKYPGLPTYAARRIYNHINKNVALYGFVICQTDENYSPQNYIGLFQSKLNWWDNSGLALIGHSVIEMNKELQLWDDIKSFSLNFPGIGYGGLNRNEVLPILKDLDDRVTVYEF